MWETRVQSLGWEDLLEKEMVTHSSILAWKIPWTEKPGRLQAIGSQELDMTEQLHFHFSLGLEWKTDLSQWCPINPPLHPTLKPGIVG